MNTLVGIGLLNHFTAIKNNCYMIYLPIFLLFLISSSNVFSKNINLVTADPRFSSMTEFEDIPFAEDVGIVLNSKLLEIAGAKFPFNPSIIRKDNYYIIAFREDTRDQKRVQIEIKIGYAKFSLDFTQMEPIKFYEISFPGPHDPRIFYCGGKMYLTYAYLLYEPTRALIRWDLYKGRQRQGLSSLDEDNTILKNTSLDYGNQFREKNWTPFEYIDEQNNLNLYFVYKFNPLEIIKIDASNNVKLISKDEHRSAKIWDNWERKWGEIRGGTSALLVDNEYLTFFHSCFGKRFYVFGALTFESRPPFRITKISKFPIIFRDCYTAKNAAAIACGSYLPNVIFPCGFVEEKINDNRVFYILGGENEQAARLITIDKNTLYNFMITVE